MPHTKKWLQTQFSRIGGSAAADVLGMGYAGAHGHQSLARTMLGLIEPLNIDDLPDVRRGRLLEPIALKILREDNGLKCKKHDENEFLANKAHPYAHCLVDGWATDVPIEIKWPRPGKAQKIIHEGLPEMWAIQAQHELMVIEHAPELLFVVGDVVTMDLIVTNVVRDSEFIANLAAAEKQFFDTIKRGKVPELPSGVVDVPIPETATGMKTISSQDAMLLGREFIEAKTLLADSKEIWAAVVERAKQLMKEEDNATALEILDEQSEAMLRWYHQMRSGKKSIDKDGLDDFLKTLQTALQKTWSALPKEVNPSLAAEELDAIDAVLKGTSTADFQKTGKAFSTFLNFVHPKARG